MSSTAETHAPRDVADVENYQQGHVFKAISAVKEELNSRGIAKSQENERQGYRFRGIDLLMDAISGPFARNNIAPGFSYRQVSDTLLEGRSGGAIRHVLLELTVSIVSLVDGSTFTVGPIFGEATDTLDKAYTKATSIAFRNAMFILFTVPFGPEADPEYSDVDDGVDVADTGVAPVAGAREAKIEVSESQERVLNVKLKKAGKDVSWLLETFGGVYPDNINEAIKFIEKGPLR